MTIPIGLLHILVDTLWTAFVMFWSILWPLILGLTISDVIRAVVPKQQMVRLMGNDKPKMLATACGLGAVSSSCSYAAVAIATNEQSSR